MSASGGGKEKEEWGRSKDTRATRVISVWRLDSIAMRGKIKEETTKQYPRAGKLSVLSGSGFKFAAFVLDSVLFFFFFNIFLERNLILHFDSSYSVGMTVSQKIEN